MQENSIDAQEQSAQNAKELSDALSCLVSLCAFTKLDSQDETPVKYKEMTALFSLLHKASTEIEKDINTGINNHYKQNKNRRTINA